MWFGNNTVIIIIGILAAIAIPTFLAQRDKATIAACRSDTRNAAEAATLVAAENNGNYSTVTGGAAGTASQQGWNQTNGIGPTTFTPQNGGAYIDIQTPCNNGLGTVTFTTNPADANKGRVTGP